MKDDENGTWTRLMLQDLLNNLMVDNINNEVIKSIMENGKYFTYIEYVNDDGTSDKLGVQILFKN